MTVDIRAKVYCSLGRVISGTVSDSYIQGQGLIFTRGTIEIAGVVTPGRGIPVSISYSKNGRLIRLPRELFALSFFADPYRRRTTVSLGCRLTVISEESFGETTLKAAQTKPEVPCNVFNTINLGMEANDIAVAIISKIGLTSEPDLQNHFNIDEFVIPSQPLSVLSDLLVSECKYGYTANGVLYIRDNGVKKGPAIGVSQIIDVGPINSGSVPGDSVVVKYSTVKLGEPPEDESDEDRAKRNWEWEEVYGAMQDVSASYYPDDDPNRIKRTVRASYQPYTFTASTYDQYDRVVQSMTYEFSVLAETNNRYALDVLRYGNRTFPDGSAFSLLAVTPKTKFTYFYYKIPPKGGTSDVDLWSIATVNYTAPTFAVKGALKGAAEAEGTKTALECLLEKEGIDPDDLSVVLRERTITYITEAELGGVLNLDSYTYNPSAPLGDGIIAIDLFAVLDNILESDTTVFYDKDPSSGITKTRIAERVIYGKTTTGQQDLATMLKEAQENEDPDQINNWIRPILDKAQSMRGSTLETRIRTEREYGLQKRPSQADRNTSYYGKTPITGSPESVQEFAGSYGNGTVEFQLPYADDDKISWSSTAGFTTARQSKAQERAAAFGRIQNLFLFGNRYGLSITLPAELMPAIPYDGIILKAAGDFYGVNYMTNGTTYTFDENGIVASSDLLGYGVPI